MKVWTTLPTIARSSLSLLGRVPPIHLLVSALLFLPGQALTRSLQLNYFCSLDPGASGSVHLYSSVFGVTAAVILFRNVKVERRLTCLNFYHFHLLFVCVDNIEIDRCVGVYQMYYETLFRK